MNNQTQKKNKPSGLWISLMDYANTKNISLSTLRRHIKAQKLTFKVEDGRYLLWDENPVQNQPSKDVLTLESQLNHLTQDLNHAQEEIAELKTLIAFYEEHLPQQRFNN